MLHVEFETASTLYRIAILATLTASATSAHAFVGIVGLVPEQPQANKDVYLIVQEGICDDVIGAIDIVRDGNFILATVHGTRSYGICGNPVFDNIFSIGQFAPGLFELQLNYAYNAGFPDSETEIVGTVSFTVTSAGGGATSSVPTIGLAGRISLVLLLLAVSIVASRRYLR